MNHVVYTAKVKQIRMLGTICKLCIEVLELFLFLFLYDAVCLVCDVGYIYLFCQFDYLFTFSFCFHPLTCELM
jgi:hypothetical protein